MHREFLGSPSLKLAVSFGHGIFFVPNGQRSPAIDDRECLIKGVMQTSFRRASLSDAELAILLAVADHVVETREQLEIDIDVIEQERVQDLAEEERGARRIEILLPLVRAPAL